MSIKVMSRVWEKSKQKGSALLCLLALADWSDDDGISWYGIAKLTKKLRLSERGVQRLIKALAATNELHVEYNAGPRKTNLYFVTTGVPLAELQSTCKKHVGADKNLAETILARGDKMTGVTFHAKKRVKNVTRSVISVLESSDSDPSSSFTADAADAVSKPKRRSSTKKTKEPPKPAAYSSNTVFDALTESYLGATDAAEKEAVGWRAGLIREALIDHVLNKRATLGLPPDMTESDQEELGALIRKFGTWFDSKHPGCDRPLDAQKFVDWWIPFIRSITKKDAAFKPDPKCKECGGEGFTIVIAPDGHRGAMPCKCKAPRAREQINESAA